MKKIFLTALIGLLIGIPAYANTCSFGEHWEENITEGYYTQGACINMPAPTCLSGHYEGWGWFKHWVCDSYSTPTCLEYEQIWHEPVDEGMCVVNEITPKPTCQIGEKFEGNWNGEQWTGKCNSIGGLSWIQLIPRLDNRPLVVNGKTISFLASKFGIGTIYLRPITDTTLTFPINTFGNVDTFQLPQVLGAGNLITFFSGANDFGYQYKFTNNKEATYHTISVDVPAGQYYARASFIPTGAFAPVFGLEQKIDIK